MSRRTQRPGLMAPPGPPPARRGLMAAETPLHRDGLMRVERGAFDGFDPHAELRRLLWCAVAVLATVLYLGHLALGS